MKHCSFWSLLIFALAVSCTALPLGVSNAWAQEEEKAEAPAETPAAEEKPAEEPAPAAEEAPAAEAPAAEAPAAEAPAAEAPAAEETVVEETVVEDAAPAAEEAAAEEAPTYVTEKEFSYTINTLIMFVCAILVLLMQGGFAMVEIGLNAAKNASNILAKNLLDLCIGALLFLIVGYGLMYPGGDYAGKWFGFAGYGVAGFGMASKEPDLSLDWSASADFMFQVAFAATAATIVSGAVAGRMKFGGYLIYSAVLTAFIYPISGMWKWGGGWLAAMGFADFAGSVVVHAVGGFAGLAGALLLGPRIGRYVNGKSVPMPGHSIPFAALGVFILWVGWYGFNPGSLLTYSGSVNASATAYIGMTTTIAGATGAIVAMALVWIMFGKPDVSMALNGALAGLVGITANCDQVGLGSAIAIGGIAGVIVVFGVVLLDKLHIDDPVGAFPVHGMCGVWGGIATGIFGESLPVINDVAVSRAEYIKIQLIGTAAIAGWAFIAMIVVFAALKVIGMLRVSPEHELEGLDITEHGMHAYPPSWVAADDFGAGPTGTAPAMYSKSPASGKVEVSPGNA